MSTFDRVVEHLAREQHGAFTTRQVQAAGGSHQMIRTRTANGAWNREIRGVYTLAAFPRTWEQRLMCAQLSKPGSAIAGRSAAALHGLADFSRSRPELVVPPGSNHQSPLARVHEYRQSECTLVDGIPVTTVRQTIIDLAGTVPFEKLRRATESACIERVLAIDDLARRFQEIEPLRPQGAADVRRVLDELGDAGYVPPASELERLLYALLDELRIDVVRQASLPWRAPAPMRVDALVPAWRLILEADGRRWHTRLEDWARDRARDNLAAAHGYRVLRFTHRMLTRDRDAARALIESCRPSRATVAPRIVA